MERGIITSLLFLFCMACSSPTTNSKTSSTTTKKDSATVWLGWVSDSLELTNDDRKRFLQKAYRASSNNTNRLERIDHLVQISYATLGLGDSTAFRRVNKELMYWAEKEGDHQSMGMAHWDMADFQERATPDSAYYHYREAYMQFSMANLEGNNKDYPARMLYQMASIKENSKDYVGAEQDAIKAIESFKRYNSNYQLFSAYDLLATIQNGLEKFDKALEYHQKAEEFIQYAKPQKRFEYGIRTINNTAFSYLRSHNYKKASNLFTELFQKDSLYLKNPRLYAQVLSSKAYSDFKNGDTNYKNMLGLLAESSRLLDSMDNRYDIARNYQYIGEILAQQKDTLNAIANGALAEQIAQETKNNDRRLSALKLLTTLDKENSAEHAKAYFNLSETLQLQERAIRDKFARIQMETDQIIQENESLAKRTELLAGIALGLVVLGIGVFTIVSQRISNQRLKFKQKQQENNQEIYNLMLAQHGKMEEGKKSEQKRVSEELHDGILGQMLGIRLVLSGLNERSDTSAIEQRAELIVKLQELEEEIRTISHELNAAAYKKVHNFILSLEDLVETVRKSSGMAIDFNHDPYFEWDSLHSDIKIHSYRIVQEALQNCVKHAQCKNVTIAFLEGKNSLNLTIKDDGIGFNDSKVKKGIGLKNIISRVEKMGAQLNIESEPSKGTKVEITICNIDLKRQHPELESIPDIIPEPKTKKENENTENFSG